MQRKLTVERAIKEGFTHYGYDADSYQFMNDIKIDEPDFTRRVLLFRDAPYYTPSIEASVIADLIANQVSCDINDQTSDDTDDSYDLVMKLDFSLAAQLVNDALSHKQYYKLTDIELIP